MQYIYDGEFYKAVKISGPKHNLLGISFGMCDCPKILSLNKKSDESLIDENDVLSQVKNGIEKINEELGAEYSVSQIQFVSSDTPSEVIYDELAQEIVKRLHQGGEFVKV